MTKSNAEADRLKANRLYFEDGCICIASGRLPKYGASVSDRMAVYRYEQLCKCSRNYVEHGPRYSDLLDDDEVAALHFESVMNALVPALFAAVDPLPLECDGLTRVLSTVFQRHGIEHVVCIGHLSVDGLGEIPYHWWIRFANGEVCDLRARMWLGDEPQVPHGIFSPLSHHHYQSTDEPALGSVQLPHAIFSMLANHPVEAFDNTTSPEPSVPQPQEHK